MLVLRFAIAISIPFKKKGEEIELFTVMLCLLFLPFLFEYFYDLLAYNEKQAKEIFMDGISIASEHTKGAGRDNEIIRRERIAYWRWSYDEYYGAGDDFCFLFID